MLWSPIFIFLSFTEYSLSIHDYTFAVYTHRKVAYRKLWERKMLLLVTSHMLTSKKVTTQVSVLSGKQRNGTLQRKVISPFFRLLVIDEWRRSSLHSHRQLKTWKLKMRKHQTSDDSGEVSKLMIRILHIRTLFQRDISMSIKQQSWLTTVKVPFRLPPQYNKFPTSSENQIN